MKTKLLLPEKFKVIGFIILLVAIAVTVIPESVFGDALTLNLGILSKQDLAFEVSGKTDLLFTIKLLLFLVSLIFISFAHEKIEDEFIAELRLTSWMWAIVINYSLLLVAIMTVYGLNFLNVLMYNIFTPLIIFTIRFNFLLYVNSKKQSDEK